MTKLKPSDVFAKCIENIETWCWTQRTELDCSTGASCSQSHIRFATGELIDAQGHGDPHLYDYHIVVEANGELTFRCFEIFKEAINNGSIINLNDKPGRTKKEVIEAFKKAYDLALSRGE